MYKYLSTPACFVYVGHMPRLSLQLMLKVTHKISEKERGRLHGAEAIYIPGGGSAQSIIESASAVSPIQSRWNIIFLPFIGSVL